MILWFTTRRERDRDWNGFGDTRIADLHMWRVRKRAYSCVLTVVTHDAVFSADTFAEGALLTRRSSTRGWKFRAVRQGRTAVDVIRRYGRNAGVSIRLPMIADHPSDDMPKRLP